MTARKAAGKPASITTGLGEQLTQIQPHSQLLADLQILISERDEALAELVRAKKQAKEADKGALVAEEAMQGMHKERDEALEELARGKETWEKLEKEKEEEAKGLKGEMERHAKAWEEKEREWEEERARETKISQEDKDSLMMGREREREGWKGEVERLESKKAEEEEIMRIKMKKERGGWAKKEEGWAKEKEGWEREREEERKAKGKIEAENKSLKEDSDRAVRRIAELEEEIRRLNEERRSSSGLGEEAGQRTPRGGNRRGAETPRGGPGGSPWGKPLWRPPG